MDMTGSKFTLNASPTTTIHNLKLSSYRLHSIPPPQQRLVYMGKALNAAATSLRMAVNGIPSNANGRGGDGRPDEAANLTDSEMRDLADDLTETVENRRRVKMLGALLILVSLMQLLTLFTILAGIQSEPNPSSAGYGGAAVDCSDPVNCHSPPSESSAAYVQRKWKNADFVDLAISVMGVWVGMTGLKASQDE
ncbi:hypothetical protein TrRE_jg12310, partial [Triparma retinervis]